MKTAQRRRKHKPTDGSVGVAAVCGVPQDRPERLSLEKLLGCRAQVSGFDGITGTSWLCKLLSSERHTGCVSGLVMGTAGGPRPLSQVALPDPSCGRCWLPVSTAAPSLGNCLPVPLFPAWTAHGQGLAMVGDRGALSPWAMRVVCCVSGQAGEASALRSSLPPRGLSPAQSPTLSLCPWGPRPRQCPGKLPIGVVAPQGVDVLPEATLGVRAELGLKPGRLVVVPDAGGDTRKWDLSRAHKAESAPHQPPQTPAWSPAWGRVHWESLWPQSEPIPVPREGWARPGPLATSRAHCPAGCPGPCTGDVSCHTETVRDRGGRPRWGPLPPCVLQYRPLLLAYAPPPMESFRRCWSAPHSLTRLSGHPPQVCQAPPWGPDSKLSRH